MKKVLLVNTSAAKLYSKAKVKEVYSYMLTPLTLVTLAAPLVKNGHEVQIFDLNLSKKPQEDLEKKLEEFRPDFVGVTFTTATFYQMASVVKISKQFDKNIVTIGGGPHASYDPKETLAASELDIAVVGEGDFSLLEIVSGKQLNNIKGISFKANGKIINNPHREKIIDLDSLPFPIWDIIDKKKYKMSPLIRKKLPVGAIETSRGCPFQCVYCSKSVLGPSFIPKSVGRVVDEIEFMLETGFKEIQIVDDCFSADIKRSKAICDEIKKRGLEFVWNLRSGMRIDRVDEELLNKLSETGCYRTSFGIESGNQQILNTISKGITLDMIRKVFKMIKNFPIETIGFFMLALPGDTEKTMTDTINFAKEIDPNIAKATITTPFPGTPLFNQLGAMGLVKSRDWSKYFSHDPSEVYDHPTLSWKTIFEYYDKFYREFYFRPSFIFRRFVYGIKNGSLLYDAKSFISTKW